MRTIEFVLDKEKNDIGVFAISLVDRPAIKTNFLKLSETENKLKTTFHLSDNDKMVITGPAMIPDQLIYRSAEQLSDKKEAYIYYNAETIKDLSPLFLKELRNNNVTLQHMFNANDGDVSLFESWLIENSECDKSKHLGYSLPSGTWMISLQIHSSELWKDIKNNKYNGFSIEATMNKGTVTELAEYNPKNEKLKLVNQIMKVLRFEYNID